MYKRRVAITGMGVVSPFGWGLSPLLEGLTEQRCSIAVLPDSDTIGGMSVKVGGKAPAFDAKVIPREFRRSMPPMSIMAFAASCEALQNAGITPSTPLAPAYTNMGVCLASTTVSATTLEDFFKSYFAAGNSVETVRSTVFFKVMGNTLPSNLIAAFGLSGRAISPAAACASSLQALGLAYECIAAGRADMVLAGGAEEFHPLLPATFDRIGAATHSVDPDTAARPFDALRSGIVCSEGAGIMLLEEYTSATNRGAPIIGEILGFCTNSSPESIVFPDRKAIGACMRGALNDADLSPDAIDLVNAHATATYHGDMAEGNAIAELFGSTVPVNSLKGYMGHTFAASGSLELAACISAGKKSIIYGTRNLTEPDTQCGELMLSAHHSHSPVRHILKNSFGLGGVNCSLVVKLL